MPNLPIYHNLKYGQTNSDKHVDWLVKKKTFSILCIQSKKFKKELLIYRVQMMFPYTKIIIGTWWSTYIIFNLVKNISFCPKPTPKDYMVEKTFTPYLGLLGPI